MMIQARTLASAIALATGLAATSAAVAADAYPSKPIRVIVPFAPGGSTDIIARLVTPRPSQELGQAMVVENKGCAGCPLRADTAARADPQGRSLPLATVPATPVHHAFQPTGSTSHP